MTRHTTTHQKVTKSQNVTLYQKKCHKVFFYFFNFFYFVTFCLVSGEKFPRDRRRKKKKKTWLLKLLPIRPAPPEVSWLVGDDAGWWWSSAPLPPSSPPLLRTRHCNSVRFVTSGICDTYLSQEKNANKFKKTSTKILWQKFGIGRTLVDSRYSHFLGGVPCALIDFQKYFHGFFSSYFL